MNKKELLLSIAEECDTIEELEVILNKENFTAYNGFEPSGRMHIAQALLTVLNTNEIINCGGNMIIYIADWFAKMNNKMDGDLNKIKIVGRYFIEIFKALGLNNDKVKFVWASEFINENHSKYWERVIDISSNNSVSRIKRCCQIMGRKESDELSASQLLYPAMQVADIFELHVDICQLGVDQRKVNMLAREYAEHAKLKKPVILSHHMLMGLKGPKGKMSKSDPSNAIFVDDTNEEVLSKILKAYCTDDIIDNPIYEYIKYILFRSFNKNLVLCGKLYNNIEEINKDFSSMNKKELKEDVAKYINIIIEPINKHFNSSLELKQLLKEVKNIRK